MKKHDISSLEELSNKAKNNLEWFWKSVDEDIGIVWDKPYSKVLDVSKDGIITTPSVYTLARSPTFRCSP